MREICCVPMIALCLLLGGCGAGEEEPSLLEPYQSMTACTMEAIVTCDQEGLEWEALLRCHYVPDGESRVEVLEPETIAGVTAVLDDADWRMEYQGESLNVGTISSEEISPAMCLPRLMYALREGWLLEENEEVWNDTPCLRVCFDQSNAQDGSVLSTLWLRQEDGILVRGELSVDGETILTADFISCSFDGRIETE